MEQDLKVIMEGCVGCIQRKRNPDLPAVAMPMAMRFNQKVAIDLKVWGVGQYILHTPEKPSLASRCRFWWGWASRFFCFFPEQLLAFSKDKLQHNS
jgi:hypothetical protein